MDDNRISIKIAEISINKFNSQIHQKVIQLRSFRNSNSPGDCEKLRKEAINCLRVIKELKRLLIEIDNLRKRTRESDHDKFDELVAIGKNEALKEIKLYQDMKPLDKLNELSPNATMSFDDDSSSTLQMMNNEQVQLRVDDSKIRQRELESKEALLRDFENLNRECTEISQLFKDLHGAVVEQAPMVDVIEQNVEETEVHVEEGQRQLLKALSYKNTMYPILGGLFGAVVLGPVGLVAGIKAGSAATVCGGICGYAGGKFLKKANTPCDEEPNTVSEVAAVQTNVEEAKV